MTSDQRPRIQIYEPPVVPLGRPAQSPLARDPRDPRHFQTPRLTPEGVRAIKARLLADPRLTYEAVAKEFGVTYLVVKRIMSGKRWKSVK